MRRIITGKVVSDKGDKTIVVRVETSKPHPIYKKRYNRNRQFMAHDEKNEARVGDSVMIRESRPLSARKKFILEKIVERAQTGFEATEADLPIGQAGTPKEVKK